MINLEKLRPGQLIYFLGEKDKITEAYFIDFAHRNHINPDASLLKIKSETTIIHASSAFATYKECALERIRILENIKRKINRDLIKISKEIIDLQESINKN